MSLPPELLTLGVFLARVLDVSLGTLRTLLLFRGNPYVAALLGFLEVGVWLIAAGQVLQNLDRWYLALAYAAGFATGNIVGTLLERRLALGTELVRTISHNHEIDLAGRLRQEGYEPIEVQAQDAEAQPVEVIFTILPRRKVPVFLSHVKESDPDALSTISDVKRVPNHTPGPRKSRFFTSGWRAVNKRK